MATTEKYTTVIELNSEQAKHQLDELKRKVESWKSDLAEAREKKMGRGFISEIRKELREAEKEMKKYDSEVSRTIETLNDLGSASVERIEEAQKNLRRLASEVPHDSALYQSLNEQLGKVSQELENIKATKAFEQMQLEAIGATKTAEQLRAELDFINQTAENASTASVKQLQLAERTAEDIRNSTERGTEEWNLAGANLDKIRGRLSEIDNEEKKIVTTIDRYEREIKDANKSIEVTRKETELVERTLGNISSANIRDLEYSIKILNDRLRDIPQGTEDAKNLTKQLKQLKKQLGDIKDLQDPGKKGFFSISRMWDGLNKNWGAITQAIGLLSGLSFTIRRAVAAYSEMEQEMANVRKYTGQTAEEVERMNEDFKGMDTRTAREELNKLAGAAGRLGITETAMVKEFVDGADKIRVALGDDLGDGAVDTIGKLAIAFGEDKTKGLRGAMLATGSALNELVQSSPAQAQPIIEFTSKLSGVGQQAHLTQAQIMGFAAALDQNNQEMATSSTVMSQLITKMYQDPARFAKMAGMEVESFAKKVKEDMNGALMEWLQNVNKLGDMSVLASKFEELKMDGTRAVGVLATLAGHVDQVAEAQRTATKAYEEGTSVINEFNVQNETVQAKTEKAKKRFHDLTIELGEKLLPVVKYTINGSSMLVKALSVVIDFTGKHWRAIVTLTSGVVAYYTALNIVTIKEKLLAAWIAIKNGLIKVQIALTKTLAVATRAVALTYDLLTGKIKLATYVQRIHNKVVMSNPYIAAAAAVMALVGAILKLTDRTKDVTAAQKALQEVTKQANTEIAGEKAEIMALVAAAKDKTLSDEDRIEKIEQLKKKYPGYLDKLSLEKIYSEEATTAITNLTDSLMAEAKARIIVQKIMEAEEKKQQLDEKYFKGISGLWQGLVAELKSIPNTIGDVTERIFHSMQSLATVGDLSGWDWDTWFDRTNTGVSAQEIWLKSYQNEVEEVTEEVNALNSELKDTVILQNQLKKQRENKEEGTEGGTTGTETEKNRKYWEDELKARKEAYENTKKGSKEAAEAYKRVLEAEKELAKFSSYNTPTKRTEEENNQLEKRAEAAKAEYQAEVAEEMLAYRQGITTYTHYMEERHQITQNYYDEMKRIYGEDSTEYKKLLDNREREEADYIQWTAKKKQDELTRERAERDRSIRKQFNDEKSYIYHNQDGMQEALFQSEITYLKQRQNLYKNGSKEWMDLEMQIQDKNRQHQFELEQDFIQRLAKYREEAGQKNLDDLMQIELKGLEFIKDALIAAGKMTEEEYNQIMANIKRKYDELKANQAADNDVSVKASKSLDTAKKMAGVQGADAGSDAVTGIYSMVSIVQQRKLVNEKLKKLYGEDYQNNKEYQEAKRQLNAETMQGIVAGAQAAYSTISSMMSAVSSLAQANSDLEVAKITKNYDKQIQAAGKNEKKKKKLEEQRDKEIAAAKTKANKKAMAIELAQAVASTAMAAINAYSSAAQVPYIGYLLGPIAAAAALAAGAIQIAAIKKQHQAEAMGYYEGGFTGGRQYKKEAGVVHEGEFVANHRAVQNPAVLPFLNFLDQAQRNNTVGSLTMQDVSRVTGGGAATVVAPVVNVQTDNSELQGTLTETNDVIGRLATQLEEGIGVDIPIDGENGMYRKIKRYENLLKNK